MPVEAVFLLHVYIRDRVSIGFLASPTNLGVSSLTLDTSPHFGHKPESEKSVVPEQIFHCWPLIDHKLNFGPAHTLLDI